MEKEMGSPFLKKKKASPEKLLIKTNTQLSGKQTFLGSVWLTSQEHHIINVGYPPSTNSDLYSLWRPRSTEKKKTSLACVLSGVKKNPI